MLLMVQQWLTESFYNYKKKAEKHLFFLDSNQSTFAYTEFISHSSSHQCDITYDHKYFNVYR